MLKESFRVLMSFINRSFNTLVQNWLYLILAFITPLLIYAVGQGQEIILYLVNRDQWLNIALILLSFIALFYFIWAIPALSIEWAFKIMEWVEKKKEPNKKAKIEEMFKKLAQLYNGNPQARSIYPIRKFAEIPLLIFIYMLALVHWEPLKGVIYFLIFLFLSNIIIESYKRFIQQHMLEFINGKAYSGYIFHVILIILAALSWAFGCFEIGMIFMWMLFLYNDIFQSLIENLSSESGSKKYQNTKKDAPIKKIESFYDKSKIVYNVYALIVIACLIIFGLAEKQDLMHNISPVLIMNICFTTFIALIDLLLKTPKDVFTLLGQDDAIEKKEDDIKKAAHLPTGHIQITSNTCTKLSAVFLFINIIVILGSINTLFIKSINDHKIHKIRLDQNSYEQIGKRDSLEHYFSQWLARNGNPDTVMLAVASGGGSRAGFWTGLNLDLMAKNDPTFRKKLFAISSISGSSSGTNMLLNKWFLQDKGIVPTNVDEYTFWANLYHFNYLSSGLWGLLFSDGIRGWLNKKDDFDKDRNFYHEMGEITAFENNYPEKDKDAIEQIMLADYMTKWSDSNLRFDLPIHLVNTATTQAGKRAIVAPYIFSENLHTSAIDFYGSFREFTKTSTSQFALPMITCAKISQSFPIISSYYYLPQVGNMIDGGLYENTGSNTMFELYSYLKAKFPKQKFKVLFILNGDADNCNTEPVNSVLLNTLSSLSSTPFSGHSFYWKKRFEQTLKQNEDTFTPIEIRDKNGNWISYPLGIMLSTNTIDSIYSKVKIIK